MLNSFLGRLRFSYYKQRVLATRFIPNVSFLGVPWQFVPLNFFVVVFNLESSFCLLRQSASALCGTGPYISSNSPIGTSNLTAFVEGEQLVPFAMASLSKSCSYGDAGLTSAQPASTWTKPCNNRLFCNFHPLLFANFVGLALSSPVTASSQLGTRGRGAASCVDSLWGTQGRRVDLWRDVTTFHFKNCWKRQQKRS